MGAITTMLASALLIRPMTSMTFVGKPRAVGHVYTSRRAIPDAADLDPRILTGEPTSNSHRLNDVSSTIIFERGRR
jgi:hypothetical protein